MRFRIKLLKSLFFILLLWTSGFQIKAGTAGNQWLYPIDTKSGEGIIELPGNASTPCIYFLLFGNHSFEPDSVILERKEGGGWVKIGDKNSIVTGTPLPIALFQELRAIPWSIQANLYKKGVTYRFRMKRSGGVNGQPARDPFWDQIIIVKDSVINNEETGRLKEFALVESGKFGEALQSHIREINYSPAEIENLEESLTDPVMDLLKKDPQQEIGWKELESKALPLDYQKILLSGINDPDPGFAYQNGQWFVTWPGNEGSRILQEWGKKMDHWFAPAILVGKELIRPAPLSARTSFFEDKTGRFLPLLTIEWKYQATGSDEIKVTQSMFSGVMDGIPQIFVHLKMDDPKKQAKFAIGYGERPYAHYWDDPALQRTPVTYFTSLSELFIKNNHVLEDKAGSVVMRSSVPVRILHSGLSEVILEFDPEDSEIYLSTPQIRTDNLSTSISGEDFQEAHEKFENKWSNLLSAGSHAELPSAEWKGKIDSWLTQVCSITDIKIEGREQLSYGAYFYKAYFGVEEGWPAVALARWGNIAESERQAEILLSKENLDKSNYHHQYRNGLSSWYAASIARLTGDRDWLRSISPALITNGYWTINARKEDEMNRSPLGKGLLPAHIYGGDVSTPAYSLYSSATCLKGLIETADVFRQSKVDGLQPVADSFHTEAVHFKKRLTEVMNEVLDRESTPAFLPLALELNHKEGKNEGPYFRLTDDKLGNYWNLFAPLFLHLEILRYKDPERPSEWLTDYLENHGGHFAGLPRFYSGLDAVYSIGYIDELMERSKVNIENRIKALTALESFMVLASSNNGHTIQEVSGFFPERLDRREYERAVREAPWNFGMYNSNRYLQGHISFTEPLGAGAGEGLLLVRKSLIDEMKDQNGLPDGGVFFLSTIPAEWLKEGKEIRLSHFPTVYGTFDLYIRSFISSRREIQVKYKFSKVLGKDKATGNDLPAWNELNKILIRLVPPAEDCFSCKKIKIRQPFTGYDEWTIQLPVKDEGDFIVEF
jgi:hypothetical protein